MGCSVLSLFEFIVKMYVIRVSVWWGKSAFVLWVLENELGSSGLATSTFLPVLQGSLRPSDVAWSHDVFTTATDRHSALCSSGPELSPSVALAMSPEREGNHD